jgi:NAD-dependent SIR2 family protein deacetylase
MSDRKYRQRGYQDDDRDRQPKPQSRKPEPEPGAPAGTRRISQDGPKTINMPGFRQVVRCSQCGNIVAAEIAGDTRCTRCGTDLRTCAQCESFDPGSRFECMQTTLTARVSPKNVRNTCTFYSPRTTVERETTTPKVDSARKAFDDLFKF